MFKKEYLNHFYNIKKDEDEEISEDIKDAYLVFLRDFCKFTSIYWGGYIKKERIKKALLCNLTFKGNLTVSDEAICIWLIKLNYNVAYENSLDITRLGKEKYLQDRSNKRKQGQHDSKIHYDEYKKIFNKIKKGRADEESYNYWQKTFFLGLFRSYQYLPSVATDNHQNNGDDDNDSCLESKEVIEL